MKIQVDGGRHIGKSKNYYIPATAWPIITKFGTVMQNMSLNRPAVKMNFKHA